MSSRQELNRLEAIAAESRYAEGVNSRMVEYTFEVFKRHIRAGSVLEMGPAEGLMTPFLAEIANELTLLEGAGAFCDDLCRRFPAARVVHSLFEDFEPKRTFDNIVMGHVLEHVSDPVQVLRLAKGWLAPSGRILAAVPNAQSLHRQAAVIMGLIPSGYSFSEADIHHGHRRVYDPETFRDNFAQAGLLIEIFGGYWIKPFSNLQTGQFLTVAMQSAFMQLGERYPDIAAEIYAVATHHPVTPSHG